MGWAVAEKREAPRIEVQKSVDIMTKYIYFSGSLLNVSTRGMFIKTNKPLPEGSELEVVLYLGNEEKPRRFKGIVTWRNEKPVGRMPSGMGIQLTGRNANLFARLADELIGAPKAI